MPFIPTVALQVTYICRGIFAALSCMYLSVSTLSHLGSVFPIITTEVYPPLTAEAEPVSMSSLAVKPGSLKCTWTSTSPGATISPSASMTSSPSRGVIPPSDLSTIFSTLPSLILRSAFDCRLLFGSVSVPFRITILLKFFLLKILRSIIRNIIKAL